MHGTGRVKPNGTIKRSDPSKEDATKKSEVAAPALTTRPAGPVRHKTIIDQSPVPLYCSDECRLLDMQNSFGALSDHNPERMALANSPPLPPAPHNSFSDSSLPDESDSSSGTSFDSSSCPPYTSTEEYTVCSTDAPVDNAQTRKQPRSYTELQSIYNLPPLPPPPPLMNTEPATSIFPSNDYQSGVMMSARHIRAALCPEKPKRSPWDMSVLAPSTDREPIPGWTDGSNAWRAVVYSFAAPPKEGESMKMGTGDERDPSMMAYRSTIASPHRSKGVYSTLGETTTATTTPTARQGSSSSLTSLPAQRSRSEAEEMYSKYPMTFARRSDSRGSFSAATTAGGRPVLSSSADSTRSLPPALVSTSSRRREVPILKKGAEGKLLVPDVKMRRIPSGGSMSLEGSSWGSVSVGAYEKKRSPLSRNGSEASIEESTTAEEEGTSASVPPVGMTRAPASEYSWLPKDLVALWC